MCCTSHTTAFQMEQYITQTPKNPNSHNFIYTYPKQVKKSELDSSKNFFENRTFLQSMNNKYMKSIIKTNDKPTKPYN